MSQLDRYVIESEIGRGGMGVVSRARDTELDRDVALKELTLPPTMTLQRAAEAIQRFDREAQAAAALNSPHIVEVYEAFSVDIRHFIAMELMEGPTLDKVIESGPLPPEAAIGVAEQILEALTVANGAGIVHRDLKPENVFVQADGIVKVGDFGIARLSSSEPGLTRTGQVLGTIGYMPPEQIRGDEVDGRSDIFAVGVILYQMLVGTNPFHAEQPTTAMYKISYEDPPALDPFVADLPAHITPVLAKAMAKDPNLRYQSAEEMLSDLRSGTAPDVAAILAAADARKAEREKAAAAPAAVAPVALPLKAKLPFKLDKPVLIALAAGVLLLVAVVAGMAYNNYQNQIKLTNQRQAIIIEGRKAAAIAEKVKATNASMQAAASALKRRVAINEAASASWDAQWKSKMDKYNAEYTRIQSHNAAERALASVVPNPVWQYDPVWMTWGWVYPPPYKAQILKSPAYPKLPDKLWTDTNVEVDAINKVALVAAALESEVTSASAGSHYYTPAFRKEAEAAVALAKAAADLKAATLGLASMDPRKGRLLHGEKLSAWNPSAVDLAVQQCGDSCQTLTTGYGVADAIAATSTPSPAVK